MSKKKECPSCAMLIDAGETICPICQYEFPKTSKVNVWVAFGLILLIVLYWIL